MDISDPVQWRPQEFNARSDWLCNQALDTNSSFEYVTDDLEAYRLWDALSDGACRGDGRSSYAWIIYVTWPLGNQRHRFTVAFGYELLQGNLLKLRYRTLQTGEGCADDVATEGAMNLIT